MIVCMQPLIKRVANTILAFRSERAIKTDVKCNSSYKRHWVGRCQGIDAFNVRSLEFQVRLCQILPLVESSRRARISFGEEATFTCAVQEVSESVHNSATYQLPCSTLLFFFWQASKGFRAQSAWTLIQYLVSHIGIIEIVHPGPSSPCKP